MNSKLKMTLCIGTSWSAVVAAGLFAAGQFPAHRRQPATNIAASSGKTLYTCGMHPWIIQDHPGNCPICGMKLEPVRKQADGVRHAGAKRKI